MGGFPCLAPQSMVASRCVRIACSGFREGAGDSPRRQPVGGLRVATLNVTEGAPHGAAKYSARRLLSRWMLIAGSTGDDRETLDV